MASVQVEYVQNVVQTRDLYLCVEIFVINKEHCDLAKVPRGIFQQP